MAVPLLCEYQTEIKKNVKEKIIPSKEAVKKSRHVYKVSKANLRH